MTLAVCRFAELMSPISIWVRISRSITPIVDLSILLLLADYRHSAGRMLQSRGRLTLKCFYRNNNSVEHLSSYVAQYLSIPWHLAVTSSATPYYSQSHVSYSPRHVSASQNLNVLVKYASFTPFRSVDARLVNFKFSSIALDVSQ